MASDNPSPIVKDLHEAVEKITDAASTLLARSHFSSVLKASAIVEGTLQRALLTKMTKLSGRMESTIFENYGPLSSFSAKIDLAYALGILSDDMFDKLKALKAIRNEFAHPHKGDDVTLWNPKILVHLQKIAAVDPDLPKNEYGTFFLRRIKPIDSYLEVFVLRHEDLHAKP